MPKGLCKIYHLFARIPYNSYFRKSIERWAQWFQGKRSCCIKPTLPKKHSIAAFFWSLVNFLRISIKNNSSCITQNILRKEVKQVLQRRAGGTWLRWNCWRKLSEPVAKFYCRYFYNILSEFYLNGISMDRYQIGWLLSSRKVVEVWVTNTCS